MGRSEVDKAKNRIQENERRMTILRMRFEKEYLLPIFDRMIELVNLTIK